MLNNLSKKSLLFTAVLGLGLGLGACELGPKQIGEEPGDEACKDGEMKKSEDACNDCTCVDGDWACTEKACGDSGQAPVCEEGETKPAGDGCNTCVCSGNTWSCTELGCDMGCGDGIVGEGEQCDDGNQVDDDACPNDCGVGDVTDGTDGTDGTGGTGGTEDTGAMAVCGDGVVDEGEQCDDGNAVEDDGCSSACVITGGGACGPSDPLKIVDVEIAGDALHVGVEYGGGCELHEVDGCWNGEFAESFPVQTWWSLTHDAHGDLCDAWISELYKVDLSAMKAAYQDGYKTQNGTIIIHLDGWPEALEYAF